MNWVTKLERKFGKHYIENLMLIITFGCAAFYLSAMVFGRDILGYFTLDPAKILQGQVWRLITFIFVTPSTSILYVFTIYFYYMAGSSLEYTWGAFKFNIYYLVGVLTTIIVAFLAYFLYVSGIIPITYSGAINYYSSITFASTMMNLSLFLAYAKLYPESEIYIFFVLPIKIKWLGYINWAIIGLTIIKCIIKFDLIGGLFAIVPVINYLLFFLRNNYRDAKMRTASVIRMKDYKKKINSGKKSYIHKCEVCGITNEDDPDMEFRYCSKCNGKHCYCEKHILNHEHKL